MATPPMAQVHEVMGAINRNYILNVKFGFSQAAGKKHCFFLDTIASDYEPPQTPINRTEKWLSI